MAPNGDDANDGSSSHPWATIQRGLQAAQPGEMIVVDQGSYTPASFVRGRSRCTDHTEGSGNRHGVGDGLGESNGYNSAGINIGNVSYVVVQGFDISRFDFGIELDRATNVTITGNTLQTNDAVGVQTSHGSYVHVDGNTLLDPAPPTRGLRFRTTG